MSCAQLAVRNVDGIEDHHLMADDFKSLVILAVGVMTTFSSNPISSAHMLPTVSLLGLSVFAHASLRRSAIEDFVKSVS